MTNEHMMIEDDFNAYPLLPTEITCELIMLEDDLIFSKNICSFNGMFFRTQ